MQYEISSRDYIIESFFILMKNKKMDDISIQEICNKAGVSRVTFYRNFKNKFDIIDGYFSTAIKKFIINLSITTNNNSYEVIAKETFNMLFKEKDNFKALINNNLAYLYLDLLNFYFVKDKDHMGFKNDIIAEIYAGALYNISTQWVLDDCKTPIPEMIKSFFTICNFKEE